METAKFGKYTAVQFHGEFSKEVSRGKVLHCVDVLFYKVNGDGCGIRVPVFAEKPAKKNGDYGPAFDMQEIFIFKKVRNTK